MNKKTYNVRVGHGEIGLSIMYHIYGDPYTPRNLLEHFKSNSVLYMV